MSDETYLCKRCGVDWTGAPGHPKSYCDEMKIRMDHSAAIKEIDKLKIQIQELQKNDYTGDYCAVCKLGIREKESRSESFGVWTHPICSITAQRNEALRLNGELIAALQNMTGLFGEAVTRHQMGKGFTDLHAETIKWAKDILSKTEKLELPQQKNCRVALPYGQSGVPDFCGMLLPCPRHPNQGENYNGLAVETDKD